MAVKITKKNLLGLIALIEKRYGDKKLSDLKKEISKDEELDGAELSAM